jgi:hypothetical protein
MAKTKSVGGKDYGASDFAYVGNPDDPSTWHLLIADANHVQDAMARFDQTDLPADAKGKVARKLLALAKKYGMDASGFAEQHNLKASEADGDSYEQQMQELDQALLDQFGLDVNGYRRYCLIETFPDYVIARGPDGDLYQIGYTDDNDAIKFGDPQEVETAYVPVQQSARFLAKEAAGDGDGWEWPVQIMQAGWAQGSVDGQAGVPHYFPASVVAQVAEAANGARFRRRHPTVEEGSGADMPDLTAGWTSQCRMMGGAAVGTVNLLKTETEMRAKLLAAREAGKLDLFGVSIFAYFGFQPGVQDGKKALIATRLAKYVGLDMCAEAGAGGKILPYAASRAVAGEIAALQSGAVKKRVSPPGTTRLRGDKDGGGPKGAAHKGASMRESILKVLEALRRVDAGRASELEKEFEGIAEDKHFEFFARVSEAVADKIGTAVVNDPAAANAAAEMVREASKAALAARDGEVVRKVQESLNEAKKVSFAAALERKLSESKLPIPAQTLVREHFNGVVADDSAIESYIAKVRQSFAAYETVGRTSGTVEVGRNSQDKIQLAMDAMLGVKEAKMDRNVRHFRGLREAYMLITGDRDLNFDRGGFLRVSEAIGTADFPNILLNSLAKKLLQDYTEYQVVPGLEKLYVTSALTDYKTQDRVRMGYLSDLPTVTETGAYTELTKPTDEKISYTIAKRGGLLTISEETIRNDDLGKIAQFPNRMARAARHTLASFVTTFFTTPPNYDPDGLAWFHATHNNLGSTALSSAELDARAIALAKQSEKDSGNRLGLPLEWIMIPVDLRPTAMQINRNQSGTNNWYQKFGANEENIVVNPLLTDVTDWYYGCFPASAPFLEIGFLDGYETPQIFIANLPTQGTQFTNDQLQYKVKFVFGGKPIDFRGVGKEVVAG